MTEDKGFLRDWQREIICFLSTLVALFCAYQICFGQDQLARMGVIGMGGGVSAPVGGAGTCGSESVEADDWGPGATIRWCTISCNPASNVTIKTFSIYLSASATLPNIQIGVYDGSNNLVGTTYTSEVPATSPKAWVDFDVSAENWTMSAGTTYWICWQMDSDTWESKRQTVSGSIYYATTGYGDSWATRPGTGATMTASTHIDYE